MPVAYGQRLYSNDGVATEVCNDCEFCEGEFPHGMHGPTMYSCKLKIKYSKGKDITDDLKEVSPWKNCGGCNLARDLNLIRLTIKKTPIKLRMNKNAVIF